MKNVLTFLTVVMLAVASQAIQIPWGSGILYRINPDGTLSSTKMNNTTARAAGYLFSLTEEEYNALNVADIISTYFDETAPIPTLKSGITATVVGASNKSGLLTMSTYEEATIGNKYYAAVVYTFTDTEGNIWIEANKGYTSINPLGDVEGEKTQDLAVAGGAGATGWAKYEAVPEPTTVALLAFGLAAVGLKRKRA